MFARYSDGRIRRDEGGQRIVEYEEDQVAVWNSGIRVFQSLSDKDLMYAGLKSRDFRVTRRGTGLDTTYAIDPADADSGSLPLEEA